MSLTANELNYLIWRYLQEGGLDLSAYALQDETKVDQYEKRLGSKVPLGCLVDLVQKGILYDKVNELVTKEGKTVAEDVVSLDFNLFGALKEEATKEDLKKRRLSKDNKSKEQPGKDGKSVVLGEGKGKSNQTEGTLHEIEQIYPFTSSLTCGWSPSLPEYLVWGGMEQSAQICDLNIGKDGKCDPTLKSLPHPMMSEHIVAISWSPDGKSIVTGSENGELRMWDISGSIRFIMALHHSPVLIARWSPNGSHLLTMDVTNRTIIWDSSSGRPVQSLELDKKPEKFNGTDACWIDDYKFVIPGSDYKLCVYQLGEMGSQEPIGVLSGHTASISFVSYNQELKLLCSASEDCSIRIWRGDSTNSLQILIGHSEPITYLHWLHAEDPSQEKHWYLVSCSLDSSLRIWDFVDGQIVDLKVVGDGQPIISASISHDGGKLVTGDSRGRILLWELSRDLKYRKTAQLDMKLDPANSMISTISWSKDDSKIAIGCSGSSSTVLRL